MTMMPGKAQGRIVVKREYFLLDYRGCVYGSLETGGWRGSTVLIQRHLQPPYFRTVSE